MNAAQRHRGTLVVGGACRPVGRARRVRRRGRAGRDSQASQPRAADDRCVRVVEQPLDVTLSMPGELDPYQTVAIYPRVTGFVKTIGVDRGSRVRAGELLAELEAPELAAQRAEAQSKLQSARSAARRRTRRRPMPTRAPTTS